MAKHRKHMNEKLGHDIHDLCRHIAGSCTIAGAYIYGDFAVGLTARNTVIQVLEIIVGFQPRIKNYAKILNHSNVSLLAVDKWTFERDVDKGFLGEALVSGLIFPYISLINQDYLHEQEVLLKKRLILEHLENLVLNFQELSYEFHIKPQYFMYEAMLRRARLFPPMLYTMSDFIKAQALDNNAELALHGFLRALEELESEDVVTISEGFVRISKEFMKRASNHRTRFTNLLKTGQRALFASLLGIFPQILNAISQNKEFLADFQRFLDRNSIVGQQTENPHNYIYIPTASGLVPLANRIDIKAFARKVLHTNRDADVQIKSIGGILNDVYLVSASKHGKERRAVVKSFRDWSSFKWFPLTLWAVGTRSFAVLGGSRLQREYAMNRLLRSNGFSAPRILHISPGERLLFMEYIEGEDLSKRIKRLLDPKNREVLQHDLNTMRRVGRLLAEIHANNIALGDAKPENFHIDEQGEIYLMDLEQASRDGDQSWDIAEFLYYAGHYSLVFTDSKRMEKIAKTFVEGYLKAGGNPKVVRKAGNPKYTKVFSVFTLPSIMFAVSNICRKTKD